LITEELHGQFQQGYAKDTVYGPIRQDLINAATKGKRPGQSNEAIANASIPGNPFRLQDHLLYFRNGDAAERLVVPRALIQLILEDVHNNRHHFSRNRILAQLEGMHFQRKRFTIDKYIKGYQSCKVNRNSNQAQIKSLQPIPAPVEPIKIIAIDFIIALPLVPSRGTP